MLRKILFFTVFVSFIVTIGYQYRIELMLGFIRYQAQNEFEESATREVSWQNGPKEPEISPGERPPNIILIVADDLGINDISTFGGGIDEGSISTPSIDSLANDGAMFLQSYSGASTCAPSRAAMMTGRYPTRTGFEFTPVPDGMGRIVSYIYNDSDTGLPPVFYDASKEGSQRPFLEQGLPSSEITLAEVLKERGYYTAHIGKWHLGRSKGMTPNDQGFDDSLLMNGGLYLPEDHPNVVNARIPFDPIDQFLWARLTYANSFNAGIEPRFEPDGYMTDYWTDEATKVIKANKNRPFFLYLAHWGPHTPLQATREDYQAVGDIKPHRKRVYAAMVRSIDRSVRRVLQTLDEEGLADNTIVVFTSDNGGAGYVGLPDTNQPYRGWKITMFEGGIRVPMFVKWPAQIDPGSIIEAPVSHIDLMPTLAAAAGAKLPTGVPIDGKDILTLLEPETDWSRRTLYWQNGHYQVVRHDDWKLQINQRPQGGYKEWLFDLKNDPTEQVNLAEQHPQIISKLKALLKTHNANARPPLYGPTTDLPVMVDKTLDQLFQEGDEYIYTPN